MQKCTEGSSSSNTAGGMARHAKNPYMARLDRATVITQKATCGEGRQRCLSPMPSIVGLLGVTASSLSVVAFHVFGVAATQCMETFGIS